jgi:hypothetical protein
LLPLERKKCSENERGKKENKRNIEGREKFDKEFII